MVKIIYVCGPTVARLAMFFVCPARGKLSTWFSPGTRRAGDNFNVSFYIDLCGDALNFRLSAKNEFLMIFQKIHKNMHLFNMSGNLRSGEKQWFALARELI